MLFEVERMVLCLVQNLVEIYVHIVQIYNSAYLYITLVHGKNLKQCLAQSNMLTILGIIIIIIIYILKCLNCPYSLS